MSKKMTAALLIVSLSFNLAILGVFLYKQFVPSPMPYAPRHIPPPFRAMGVDEQLAQSAIRISLGVDNTLEQVRQFVTVLNEIIKRLKPS